MMSSDEVIEKINGMSAQMDGKRYSTDTVMTVAGIEIAGMFINYGLLRVAEAIEAETRAADLRAEKMAVAQK